MFRIPIAAAMCVAALAYAAPPAVADAEWNGPNCQGSVVSGAVTGVGLAELAARFGVSVQFAHEFIQSGCAGSTSNTPRCEAGELEAAQAAFDRGDVDQYLFHLGAVEACFLGESPGPPL